MSEFPSIDEVHEILNDISEELPEDFFKELNEGVVLLPEVQLHPESRENDRLYVMGRYVRSITGRNIALYYGSFKRVYPEISRENLKIKLRETLIHEFVHHMESLAGDKGLEIKDAEDMQNYRNRR